MGHEVMESAQSKNSDPAQKKFFLRLIPGKSVTGPKCTMFAIRDATDALLLVGERWGDDYLVVDGEDNLEITKALLDEADFPYEEVLKLPHSHMGALA